MMMHLAPETIDGLLYGWAMECNPVITARRKAYEAKLQADQIILQALPAETLRGAIRACRLWTIEGWESRKTKADMIEAISRCMQGKKRPIWWDALGLTVSRTEIGMTDKLHEASIEERDLKIAVLTRRIHELEAALEPFAAIGRQRRDIGAIYDRAATAMPFPLAERPAIPTEPKDKT